MHKLSQKTLDFDLHPLGDMCAKSQLSSLTFIVISSF